MSLTLSGDNSSTPGQLALFLSRFPSLSTIFTKLETLRLIDFTKVNVQLLLPQLPTLSHLKCLSIGNDQRLTSFNLNIAELFDEAVALPICLRSLAFPYQITNKWMKTYGSTKSFVEQMHIQWIHMDLLSSYLQKFPHLKRLTAVVGGIKEIHLLTANSLSNATKFHALRSLNVNILHTVSRQKTIIFYFYFVLGFIRLFC